MTQPDALESLFGGSLHERDKDAAKLRAANDRIGPWLSAALEDPQVCAEMKADIAAWFAAFEQ